MNIFNYEKKCVEYAGKSYFLKQQEQEILQQSCMAMYKILWYVLKRAIFGAAGMGRDDGYYCGVLFSGVSFVSCWTLQVLFIHWSFIVWDLENKLAVSCQLFYQVTYTIHRPTLLPTPKIFHLQSSYIECNIERKTRIESFAYYSISKGFEMVACDVAYCIVL